MSLVNFNNFEGVASRFRQQREESKQLQENVMSYVEENTQQEKKQLDEALKNYNDKITEVMKNKQSEIDKLNEYNHEMSQTLYETFIAFNEAIDKIIHNNKMDNETKESKIQEVSEYIMSHLYSKEEVEEFKEYAKQFTILLPGNSYSKSVKAIKEDTGISIKYT